MKSVIKLSFKELEPKKIDSFLTVLERAGVIFDELKLGDGNHLLQIVHSSLNTLFYFSGSRDYQILYFNKDKEFVGATYVIDRGGSYTIQTRCKCVLLIPIETKLNTDLLNKLEKFNLMMPTNPMLG
jgi:hypothetical protein